MEARRRVVPSQWVHLLGEVAGQRHRRGFCLKVVGYGRVLDLGAPWAHVPFTQILRRKEMRAARSVERRPHQSSRRDDEVDRGGDERNLWGAEKRAPVQSAD